MLMLSREREREMGFFGFFNIFSLFVTKNI